MNNEPFGDTQYTQGLTPDSHRGDPGDYPCAYRNIEMWHTFFSMEDQMSKVT